MKFLFLFLSLMTVGTPAKATEINGKLVHVRDADTIELATSRGRIAIRLNGVDAPELTNAEAVLDASGCAGCSRASSSHAS